MIVLHIIGWLILLSFGLSLVLAAGQFLLALVFAAGCFAVYGVAQLVRVIASAVRL